MTTAEASFVQSLFVTLRRGYAGTPWFHRRILQALGLKHRHQCVEKPNNSSIRGMLHKVPHLVIIETDRMHYLRRMREFHEQQCRPPLILYHAAPELPDTVPPHPTSFARQQIDEHISSAGLDSEPVPQGRAQPPRKYYAERARQQRAKLLTEHGIFSAASVRAHEEDLKPKSYSQRSGIRN